MVGPTHVSSSNGPRSRRRKFVALVAVLATALAMLVGASGAQAASGPIFTVMNTSETPPDGVYFRNSPHVSDTNRVFGLGVFMNEQVQLQCYAWGDAVGAYNNTLWYFVNNVTRPINYDGEVNQGYVNAHYINDGQVANVVDAGVPQCGGTPPPPPTPTVTLAQGPAAPAGYRYAITLAGFAANTSVTITCYDSVSPSGFYSFSLGMDGAGNAYTASYCYSGDGPDHWVLAGGVGSNHVAWGTGSSGGGGGGGSGGSGGSGSGSPSYVNGLNVGYPQNTPHIWGSCNVQDFDGGPYGHVIVDFTHGTNVVRNGMLWGWFDNGGGPGFGCAANSEHAYGGAVRQDFDRGALYWVSGMNHAQRFNRDAAASWARQHAQDAQPFSAACTWFASNALWAGGLPKSATWTSDGSYGLLPSNHRPGTPTANAITLLGPYLTSQGLASSSQVGLGTNALPAAQIGDLIAYAWDGRNLDHVAVVVSIGAGGVPNVSEWGSNNNLVTPLGGHPKSPYVSRRWNWSAIAGIPLLQKYPGAAAYLLHITY